MKSKETTFMSSKIRNKPAVIVVNMLKDMILHGKPFPLSLIHISEPTRPY